MSAPLDFLKIFAARLRGAGLRFAITSGMACVYYGLQQTTKDSDWIIVPEDLAQFRQLLSAMEAEDHPWAVRYRSIFGAPLDSSYLAHGWSSHLLVIEPDRAEHKVDLFGNAPRVKKLVADAENPDFAARDVVAQMKHTDRAKDWPIVDGLGWQLLELGATDALVHIQDATKLLTAWATTDSDTRSRAAARRPLLRILERETDPDRLDGFLRLERLVWECVNNERHGLYVRAWKDFYRQWQQETGFKWPEDGGFKRQHQVLLSAARRWALSPDPVGAVGRDCIIQKALDRAVVRGQTSLETLLALRPPPQELLP